MVKNKPPTLQEIREANPKFFRHDNDKFHGTSYWKSRGWLVFALKKRTLSNGMPTSSMVYYFADPRNPKNPLELIHYDKGDGFIYRDTSKGVVRVAVNEATGTIGKPIKDINVYIWCGIHDGTAAWWWEKEEHDKDSQPSGPFETFAIAKKDALEYFGIAVFVLRQRPPRYSSNSYPET